MVALICCRSKAQRFGGFFLMKLIDYFRRRTDLILSCCLTFQTAFSWFVVELNIDGRSDNSERSIWPQEVTSRLLCFFGGFFLEWYYGKKCFLWWFCREIRGQRFSWLNLVLVHLMDCHVLFQVLAHYLQIGCNSHHCWAKASRSFLYWFFYCNF